MKILPGRRVRSLHAHRRSSDFGVGVAEAARSVHVVAHHLRTAQRGVRDAGIGRGEPSPSASFHLLVHTPFTCSCAPRRSAGRRCFTCMPPFPSSRSLDGSSCTRTTPVRRVTRYCHSMRRPSFFCRAPSLGVQTRAGGDQRRQIRSLTQGRGLPGKHSVHRNHDHSKCVGSLDWSSWRPHRCAGFWQFNISALPMHMRNLNVNED